jgi:hypothetical protein
VALADVVDPEEHARSCRELIFALIDLADAIDPDRTDPNTR